MARTLNVVWSHGGRGFSLAPVVAQVQLAAGQEKTVTLQFNSPAGVQTDGVTFVDARTAGHFAGVALRGEGVPPTDEDDDEGSGDGGGGSGGEGGGSD